MGISYCYVPINPHTQHMNHITENAAVDNHHTQQAHPVLCLFVLDQEVSEWCKAEGRRGKQISDCKAGH